MSARRQARARVQVKERLSQPGAVPAPFLIGRCTEVWSTPDMWPAQFSAMRRFNAARQAWADAAGLNRLETQALIPNGGPWSAEHLCATGRTARALERLAEAGCDLEDLPDLHNEALTLLKAAPAASNHLPKGGRHV